MDTCSAVTKVKSRVVICDLVMNHPGKHRAMLNTEVYEWDDSW